MIFPVSAVWCEINSKLIQMQRQLNAAKANEAAAEARAAAAEHAVLQLKSVGEMVLDLCAVC